MSVRSVSDVQNLREFLTIYNQLTELCFTRCVGDFNERSLIGSEDACLSKCIEKSMAVNRRLMVIFQEIGPEMMNRNNMVQAGQTQDGRQAEEQRAFKCQLGCYEQADGSAFVQMGNTKVLCAVYGPHEPKFKHRLEDNKALINCQYSMATFSTQERKLKPRGDRKSQEFTQHLEKTFNSVVMLESYARSQIDIFCEILQADGSNLAACINAGSLALCDAGIQMHGIVAACQTACVTVGSHDKPFFINDLAHHEEGGVSNARCTMAIMNRNKQVVLVEMDNRLHIDYMDRLIETSLTGCEKTHQLMHAQVMKHGIEMQTKLQLYA